MRFNLLIEKVFQDLNPTKGVWTDIPLDILKKDPVNYDITDQLIKLVSKAYDKEGGHLEIKNPNDIPGNHDTWQAVDNDDDPEPDALLFGKRKNNGLKITGTGHDGKRVSSDIALDRMVSLLYNVGNYAEASGATAHIVLTRYSINSVDDKKDVEKILGKKVEWLGKHPEGRYPRNLGWYIRDFNGIPKMKILIGNPYI